MYAVINLQWHQYIIKEWDKIVVDNMNEDEWKQLSVENVLMTFDEKWENVKIWTPYLQGWKVSIKVLENNKGEKIRVTKFKRKNRYERNIWFRPYQTVLQIEKLNI